jgi:Homeodomain-like domain-containing protein
MTPFLGADERRALRVVSLLSPCPALRSRAAVLLWLDLGRPLADVARAFGLSRPTVYRTVGLWREFRDPAALHPDVARRLRPWRSR